MPIRSYKGYLPKIPASCFVAETATICGQVFLEEECSVWFGAVLRAEKEPIRIGRRSNIQDNCVLHNDAGFPIEIGENVSFGHNATIHGATVGSNSLIGMGAILMNGSCIGRNCIVGAGSLVTQGTTFADDSLVLGSPAVVKRKLSREELEQISLNAIHYNEFRSEYLGLKRDPGSS